jgi:hypothetical protein
MKQELRFLGAERRFLFLFCCPQLLFSSLRCNFSSCLNRLNIVVLLPLMQRQNIIAKRLVTADIEIIAAVDYFFDSYYF